MPRFEEDKQDEPIDYNPLLSYLNDAYRMLYIAYQDIVVEKKVEPYQKPKKTKTWHIENVITEDLVIKAEDATIAAGLNLDWVNESRDLRKKNRIDIDIIYQSGLGKNKRLGIECKHFINEDSNTKYIDNGINRFQTGYYSAQMPIGGMLGYIEINEVGNIVKGINDKLISSTLQSYQFQSKIPNSYLSNLDRSEVKDCIPNFKLYHVFLDFRDLIKRD